MNKQEQLQEQFLQGTVPKGLNGFYKGELLLIISASFIDRLGQLLVRLWLPWKGKNFYQNKGTGDNIVPSYIRSLVTVLLPYKSIQKTNNQGLHILPFKTSIKKGLADNISVLQLDYNIPENPKGVQKIVDELVCVGDDTYLGKVYSKKDGIIRLTAYFQLKK